MAHPPSDCTIEVDLTRVLWLTRGRRWSYAILLKPLTPPGDWWMSLQSRVFAGIEPGAVPYSVAGRIGAPRDERAFVATTFLDALRRDGHGRPIVHQLVWFPPDEHAVRLVAPADWGPQLVAALAPAYDDAFAVDRADRGDERGLDPVADVQAAFDRARERLPTTLRFTGATVMLYALRPIEAKYVRVPFIAPPSPYTRARALVVWAVTFVALLLVGLVLRRGS